MIAIAVRLPSCEESFWIDELHSAWCVWDDLAEVSPRAAAGNQTPLYFWGLWFWKQCFGSSELVLRFPSVLASSLAAVVVTVGVGRVHRSLLAGFVAGCAMAVESNSIFYGTELRPFAVVTFVSAVACWLTMRSVSNHSRLLAAQVCCVLLAAAFQPTSIGVLIWLLLPRLVLFLLHRGSEERQSMTELDLKISNSSFPVRLIAIISIMAILGVGWYSVDVLSEAWQHRSQWIGMADASSLMQIWNVWPWGSLLLVPLALMVFVWMIHKFFGIDDSDIADVAEDRAWWWLGLLSLVAVILFWSVSAFGIAPVFHRRYFVACLPMLAWSCGGCIANASRVLTIRSARPWLDRAFESALILISMVPIGYLLVSQGTASKLYRSEMRLVRRGEDWKAAAAWADEHRRPGDAVYLNSGLIESRRLLADDSPEASSTAQWYLSYALRGPYHCASVIAFDIAAGRLPVNLPVVVRGTRSAAEQLAADLSKSEPGLSPVVHSFGRVQVITESLDPPSRREKTLSSVGRTDGPRFH